MLVNYIFYILLAAGFLGTVVFYGWVAEPINRSHVQHNKTTHRSILR